MCSPKHYKSLITGGKQKNVWYLIPVVVTYLMHVQEEVCSNHSSSSPRSTRGNDVLHLIAKWLPIMTLQPLTFLSLATWNSRMIPTCIVIMTPTKKYNLNHLQNPTMTLLRFPQQCATIAMTFKTLLENC